MQPAQLKTEELRLEGFHCADCAVTIEKTVAKLGGVHEVEAQFTTGKVKVIYDPTKVADTDLVRSVEKIGYKVERDVHRDLERKRLWQERAFQLTMLSGLFVALGLYLHFLTPNPTVVAILGRDFQVSVFPFLAAVLLGGYSFVREAWASIVSLRLNMDALMSIAVVGAIIIGEYVEAASLAFLYSLAEMLESYAVERARNSLRALMKLAPVEARVKTATGEVTRPVEQVQVGDVIAVRPGESVPVDGVVVTGASSVDQSPITGESVPVAKSPGDKAFAGSINLEGYLELRVTETSQTSMLARIIHLVEEAEAQKAPSQRFVEKFARVYTPTVVVAAVLVAALPPLFLDASFHDWFLKALTLLVIACPCALVISTPVSVVSALTSASRNGILIKGGVYLEEMAQIKAVALDKTGTLTRGVLKVTDVVPLNGLTPEQVLRVAASLEQRSEHPIARAIVEAADGQALADVEAFQALPGKGIWGKLEGTRHYVGRPELFKQKLPEEQLAALQSQGKTTMLVGTETTILGIIALQDEIRPEATQAVRALRARGIEVVMMTGDNEATARAIAARLGIDHFHAGLLPEQKHEEIRKLTQQYGKVAMVGDGINDAPALAAATVGIAMGVAGTDTALETADIALMSDDLTKLPYLLKLSQRARRVIKQNIGASIIIKFSLALGVFPGLVSLVVAVLVGDMGASLGVTSNALRLARIK